MTYVCRVHRAYKSRTEKPRKTKIGTEVAHVTRDSVTTFKVKRSEVNLQGAGHIVAASHTACYLVRTTLIYYVHWANAEDGLSTGQP